MSRTSSAPQFHDLASGKPLPSLRMTEAQFVAWADEDTRAEWVNGEVELMSPANYKHLRLTRWLTQVLGTFVDEHQLGELFVSESMVRLPSLRSRRLPDLHFVSAARRSIIKDTYIDGAPDLIVEIVSPDNVSRDWQRKYIEYEKAGVREYWIIDPMNERVEAYSLRNRKYAEIESVDDAIYSRVIPNFYFRAAWLWPQTLPSSQKILRELGVR